MYAHDRPSWRGSASGSRRTRRARWAPSGDCSSGGYFARLNASPPTVRSRCFTWAPGGRRCGDWRWSWDDDWSRQAHSFEPGDVFYLRTGELAAGNAAREDGQYRPELARVARERRELRRARKGLHPPAAVPADFRWKLGPIDLAARESQRRDAITGPTMRGFAVSPGRVTAAASVVLSPADFPMMRPDTVLICPTTRPAWTPMLVQARGLVTDIGGVAAHGSILAREYGIPAVMGTGNATQRIASGRLVTVDGDTGTVTLLDEG